MTITITVSGELAGELKTMAHAERVGVEELTVRILESAITALPVTQKPAAQESAAQEWAVQNRRRVALIDRRFSKGLNQAEQAELQRLQQEADRHVEELDARMLADARKMQAAAYAATIHASDES
jgi:hypothetical protein